MDEDVINESIKFANKLLDMYGDELPRFTIKNMNQSEFIMHISIASFNAGVRFITSRQSSTHRQNDQFTK